MHWLYVNHANLSNYIPNIFSLKSIDLVCMKKLDTKVNVIPIIAKADTISKTELQKFKVCIFNFTKIIYLYYINVYVSNMKIS